MTPEQTTELLKALNHHDWFLVVCGIVWLLGTILQFLVVARIKSAIENKQHFSRLRYEREMEIYREVWKAVHQFYLESHAAFGWGKNLTDGSMEFSPKSWQQARSQLSHTIEKNKPFYSGEVQLELSEFIILAFWLATELQQAVVKHDDIQKRNEIQAKVKGQYEKVESAIRKRLEQFDKVN